MIYVIYLEMLSRKISPFKNGWHCFKEMCSSLEMDNISAIKLKLCAKQRGIKGYYKLRKAELIQKMEARPDVNVQVLIPALYEYQRNS